LLEGIARSLDLNPEGGTGNMAFANTDDESVSGLYRRLRVARVGVHRNSTFFLRAESFFNVASAVDRYGAVRSYGGRSLHEQSHGESFLAVAQNRWVPGGLYLLDEPEAALSLHGMLRLLRIIYELSHDGAQFIIATHSPILIALPEAQIVECSADGPRVVTYDDNELVSLYRTFLDEPDSFLRYLLED
jgi:predicted ATPase